jgi:hypothetical protein
MVLGRWVSRHASLFASVPIPAGGDQLTHSSMGIYLSQQRLEDLLGCLTLATGAVGAQCVELSATATHTDEHISSPDKPFG